MQSLLIKAYEYMRLADPGFKNIKQQVYYELSACNMSNVSGECLVKQYNSATISHTISENLVL